MSRRVILLAWVCFTLSASQACANDDAVFVRIMAPDANWSDGSFTGHAFVCLEEERIVGLREDCYGFYPRKSGKALVGGPGVVDSEFDFANHPPARFSKIQASITKPISNDSRIRILDFIKAFDKSFTLNAANCVTFTNEVAKLAGLRTPDSTNFTTPASYVQKLRELNSGS